MAEVSTPPKTPAVEKKTRISAKELARAKVLREVDGWSWQKIADHLGFHKDTIIRGLIRKSKGIRPKAGSKSEKLIEAAEKKIEEEVAKETGEKIKRVKETRDEAYKYSQTLQKLIMATILKTKSDGIPIGACANDIQTLRQAIIGIKLGSDVRFLALGIKDGQDANDEDLTELKLQEITDDEAQSISASQLDQDLEQIASMTVDSGDAEDDEEIVIEGEEDEADGSNT